MSSTALPRFGFASLVAAPVVWAAHFLASYVTAAIWCAKAAGPERSFVGARLAITIYTAAAIAALLALGWRAMRGHRAAPPVAEDRDSAEARHRFMTFAALLLVGLSVVAVVYAGMATALAGSCR